MAKILIKNGRVWNGERFFLADVLTDGAEICAIGAQITDRADYVYDATGQTVSAGLVDAHTHLWGISTDRFGTPAQTSCFPFGVTAAADASGEQGDGALLDAMLLHTAVFAKARICNNRADFSKTEQRLALFGERAVGIKVYFDSQMSDVTDETPLREICEFAHSRGLCVMVHCANSPVPMARILHTLGKGDILTHAFHGGAHTAAEDGFAAMREAQERGVWIDVGFAGHVHTDFAVLQGALRQGIVPDLISTDITRFSAYTRGGRYGMTMCMSIAAQLGMGEADIFKAVTINPSKALGRETAWGGLRVGGTADIAVLAQTNEGFDLTDRAGNRVRSDSGYRCVLTVVNGQIVYRD